MSFLNFLRFASQQPDKCANDAKTVERRHVQRDIDNRYYANLFLQQRFIFVPNEWENMSIGKVLHFDLERGVVCHAHDYVENRPVAFIGFPMHYNEQRLNALLKLDPFERYALCHPDKHSAEPFVKPKHSSLLMATQIHANLQQNKFFTD